MTRKRFVKLLMAEGYSRNGANKVAGATIRGGYSYAEGYAIVTKMLPDVCRVARAVCNAARAAVEAFAAAMRQA